MTPQALWLQFGFGSIWLGHFAVQNQILYSPGKSFQAFMRLDPIRSEIAEISVGEMVLNQKFWLIDDQWANVSNNFDCKFWNSNLRLQAQTTAQANGLKTLHIDFEMQMLWIALVFEFRKLDERLGTVIIFGEIILRVIKSSRSCRLMRPSEQQWSRAMRPGLSCMPTALKPVGFQYSWLYS